MISNLKTYFRRSLLYYNRMCSDYTQYYCELCNRDFDSNSTIVTYDWTEILVQLIMNEFSILDNDEFKGIDFNKTRRKGG
jgi:transposase-like protein